MSGDPDTAADHTQETFIRAFENMEQFRGEASFVSWLRAITASIVLNSRRRRDNTGRVLIELETIHDQKQSAIAEQVAQRHQLERAIERLPRKLRDTFLMHDLEGYTHAEIAKALGIPVGTSKARLADARARLRRALDNHEEAL